MEMSVTVYMVVWSVVCGKFDVQTDLPDIIIYIYIYIYCASVQIFAQFYTIVYVFCA